MPQTVQTPMRTEPPLSSGWPSQRNLRWPFLAVLIAHAVVLLNMTGRLEVRLPSDEGLRVAPLQTRWRPPTPEKAELTIAKVAPPRTRLAHEPAAKPKALQVAAPAPAVEFDQAATAEPPPVMPATVPPSSQASTEEPTAHSPSASAMLSPDWAEPPALTAPTTLPLMPLGALPASTLLNYRLTGQSKGLSYHASGDLRWQHNEAAYALTLSVRAFLLGSRQWRSAGAVTAAGLAPTRFSDIGRNERAAHFDRENQRVVFSNNAPVATLTSGAQDQISLHVQLAAAMAGDPTRYQPGTRLEIQTATTRDALPWLLGVEAFETLHLMGQDLPSVKWVCQPRSRFDAKIEFWVAEKYAWMPVRIRISQSNGDFIDLLLSGQEPLPPLPPMAGIGLSPLKTPAT